MRRLTSETHSSRRSPQRSFTPARSMTMADDPDGELDDELVAHHNLAQGNHTSNQIQGGQAPARAVPTGFSPAFRGRCRPAPPRPRPGDPPARMTLGPSPDVMKCGH